MNLHKPILIDYVEALRDRTETFSEQLEEQYNLLKQGYEGEEKFSRILNTFEVAWWIHDLQLKNSNQIQYDVLVVTDEEIIQFEVKNFTGDYYYENHKLYRSSGYVAKDLLNQFEVSNEALKKIVKQYNINRKVKSYIVFINPTFTLHGDLRKRVNILLVSELYKLKDMLSDNFKYEENKRIYEKLQSLHQPFLTSHKYFEKVEFSKVRGGIRCTNCHKIMNPENMYNVRKYITCARCNSVHLRNDLIIHALKELYLLKEAPFSIGEAEKWTGVSKSTIKRTLYRNFQRIGMSKSTKYIYKG